MIDVENLAHGFKGRADQLCVADRVIGASRNAYNHLSCGASKSKIFAGSAADGIAHGGAFCDGGVAHALDIIDACSELHELALELSESIDFLERFTAEPLSIGSAVCQICCHSAVGQFRKAQAVVLGGRWFLLVLVRLNVDFLGQA